LAIGIWQLAMKKPALNNAGLQNRFEVFRVLLALPELFSWLFYVAASRLNSPRFSSLVIRLTNSHCQVIANWRLPIGGSVSFNRNPKTDNLRSQKCLVLSVSMTTPSD